MWQTAVFLWDWLPLAPELHSGLIFSGRETTSIWKEIFSGMPMAWKAFFFYHTWKTENSLRSYLFYSSLGITSEMRTLRPIGLTSLVGFSLVVKEKIFEDTHNDWWAGGRWSINFQKDQEYLLPVFLLSFPWPTSSRGTMQRSIFVNGQSARNKRQRLCHFRFPGDWFPIWMQEECQNNCILEIFSVLFRLFFLAVDQTNRSHHLLR